MYFIYILMLSKQNEKLCKSKALTYKSIIVICKYIQQMFIDKLS